MRSASLTNKKTTVFSNKLLKDVRRNYQVYLLAIPVVAFYLVFHYYTMYGSIIAFKEYSPKLGILGSKWVGFENFLEFFNSIFFGRLVRNTVLISILDILWNFPAPIILALLLNEVRQLTFKKMVQTITYLPHFISLVVVCGMVIDFTSTNGVINNIIEMFGGTRKNFLMDPNSFRSVYIASGMWQHVGWGSIIYLAALTNINQELYEAARIDGAGRLKQTWYITLPGIAPTIIILLILRLSNIMNVGHEKIILLYNSAIYETADVISTYVYRKGLIQFDYSFSAAVGLFNSAINFILLLFANKLSRRLTETSLW